MKRGIVMFALALIALLVLVVSPFHLPHGEAPAEQREQQPAAAPASAFPAELPGAGDAIATSRRAVAETSGAPELPIPAGGILVRVRDAARSAPAAGVGLVVRPAGLAPAGRRARTARTAPDGTARIVSVPEGRYEVVCDRGPRAEVDVTADRTAEVELVLAAGLCVRGIVLDADSNPVAYADIRLGRFDEPDVGNVVSRSAADGTFTLAGLGHGLTLAAEAPNAGTSFLYLLQGEAGDAIFVRLVLTQGSCALRGRVVDPAGAPVANAQVRMDPTSNRGMAFGDGARATAFTPLAQRFRADAHGRFVAERLPSGQSVLSVEEPPFRRARVAVILAPGPVAEITVRLEKGASVSGVVRDAEGRPVPGALVEWLREQRELGGRTATDARGAYRLEGLEPDRFSVIRAYARDLGGDEARPQLSVGEELRRDFRLTGARTWRGRVLDAAGQQKSAWSVFGPGGLDPVAHTDADGRFGPVQLYPWGERVTLVAVPEPRYWARPRAEWTGEWTQEEIQLRVRPEAGARVTGRVLDAGGAPLAGAFVRLESQLYGADRCDAAGRFCVGPTEEDDRVWIVDPGAMHAPRALGLKGLKQAQTLDLGDLRLVRGAPLSLHVESQVPLTGLEPKITLERAGREPYRTSAELEGRLLTTDEPIELGAWNLTLEIAGFETVREPVVVTNDPHPAATIALRAKQ